MPQRGERAMDGAPVVGLEHAPLIGERHEVEPAVDRHPGIVDPAVEAAEPLYRSLRDARHVRFVRDVGTAALPVRSAS